ncbi:KEOPS complex subunit Pcc1 [Natronolimnohabitans sp. A-GB9]|uniref:KEOPS complex subunit Pcc1 n=1 Tax=Natronolimnohabitans sp. A-GB9 TaxID=3069757 RepID=UPI0027B4214E|nr:KEOPS complex subunit Pcc1 [Natronolimnohabitans sp. A-GB9]MDQ2049211.1 KEOPS complex subunit Pcc1 [Natronolimnohabitans sp. A-GB9]
MSRRATIRTSHEDPRLVARALSPDNTDEMETVVEDENQRPSSDRTQGDDGEVVTRIERETTSGLHSTVDDYVVNLEVAVDVAHSGRTEHQPTDTGSVSDTDSNIHDNNE